MATISTEERVVRSQSVVARVVARETLIVPIRSNVGDLASIYRFNATGTLVWKLLQSPRTVDDLATAVAAEYEVDLAEAERDVRRFVNEMRSVGLVAVPEQESLRTEISGAEKMQPSRMHGAHPRRSSTEED